MVDKKCAPLAVQQKDNGMPKNRCLNLNLVSETKRKTKIPRFVYLMCYPPETWDKPYRQPEAKINNKNRNNIRRQRC